MPVSSHLTYFVGENDIRNWLTEETNVEQKKIVEYYLQNDLAWKAVKLKTDVSWTEHVYLITYI